MSISIRGINEVVEALGKPLSNDNIEAILTRACLLVERSARQKAPKGKTGDLRKYINHKVEGTEGIVFNPLEYAPYVEYGTGLYAENGGRTDVPWAYEDEETGELIWTAGQHPMPFMRPALDENRKEIIQMFREGITSND